jgi:predicted transcriptional regulator
MVNKKYIMISLEDERSKHLSDVLGNKTCKKIIDFLSENEASEKDISDKLKIPINTVEYNLNKLMKAEIIEKTKNFFWSEKGRKIDIYKLSNKSIIISPRSSEVSSKVKSILPVALISGLGAVLVKTYFVLKEKSVYYASHGGEILATSARDYSETGLNQKAAEVLAQDSNIFFAQHSPAWIWFLGGAVLAIVIFSIINWRKL